MNLKFEILRNSGFSDSDPDPELNMIPIMNLRFEFWILTLNLNSDSDSDSDSDFDSKFGCSIVIQILNLKFEIPNFLTLTLEPELDMILTDCDYIIVIVAVS